MGRGKGGTQKHSRRVLIQIIHSSSDREVKFIRDCFSRMGQEQQAIREAKVTMAVTLKALSEMESWKSLGPDGYQLGFFRKTWEVTGSAVHRFVQDILKRDEISKEAAETLLVLIPKEAKPMSLKNFRLIRLCNVSMKLVTKVIANRLKILLKEMITPTQASFIPGRISSDIVIICQEMVHSQRFTKARNGDMILKIDLRESI